MRELQLIDNQYGDGQRLSYQEHELDNAPVIPKPVEYEDIDKEIVKFFEDNVTLVDAEGKRLPMFTLFSNQRFSEYSQTWDHSDNDGNLLMNFMTINRETAPQWGTLYGGAYSIPGNNRFTLCMREIVDDTGVECYEVTSMSQPIQIDLKYALNIISSKIELINEFNTKINSLFSSKQCYIRPNGHYMPTLLDNISDNTDYTVDSRKFFIQSVTISVMAYIIPKDDIKVNLVPKRYTLSMDLDKKIKNTYVTMDFDESDSTKFKLNVEFREKVKKVSFMLDDTVSMTLYNKENANISNITINDEEVDINGTILVNKGDEVKIRIKQPSSNKVSTIVFDGILLEA